MDNYGMLKDRKQKYSNEDIELVNRLNDDGFCFDDIVEVFVQDAEMEPDDAEILVSEILQASS